MPTIFGRALQKSSSSHSSTHAVVISTTTQHFPHVDLSLPPPVLQPLCRHFLDFFSPLPTSAFTPHRHLLPASSEDAKPFPQGGESAIHMHATAASKERQLVGPMSSLPVTLFSPSSRLLPNNVFYPFGGLQPARLLCSLTMEREEVKLHSAQLIFPNMPLCRRLSFLLLLSSLFLIHLPFTPSLPSSAQPSG